MAKRYAALLSSTNRQGLTLMQIKTHQYSTTHFERDLTEGMSGGAPGGTHVQHGVTGIPGPFLCLCGGPASDVHEC